MQQRNRIPSKKNHHDEELLSTLGDFTSKENWDKFFTIRGSAGFEWYAEWHELKDHLLPLLSSYVASPDAFSAATTYASATEQPPPSTSKENFRILVPGCGNSLLSEHLYDAGFHAITNIDFSKVVISDMLRRNVRRRPGLRWRVMDMTNMQFEDGAFDAVLDKGGLDALMEPELGPKLGSQYLSEVNRVLKLGGRFICLTLAESHVLGLLFSKFRFGWKTVLHSISQTPYNKPGLRTFMVVVEKVNSCSLHLIVSSLDHSSTDCNGDQANGLYDALETENQIRKQYMDASNIIYSLKDMQLGAVGDLMEHRPGLRVQLALGGEGDSRFCYRVVLLDAQLEAGPFLYHCGVFLVPKTRAREWLFSSEEGQWVVVKSSKAARLIMVLLDSSHDVARMDEIQEDLSPLVKQLAPQKHDAGSQIPFLTASDGIKLRKVVEVVKSKLTGPIVVEDVIYETVDDQLACLFPTQELVFRRLIFLRTEGLVQSEALLTKERRSPLYGGETTRKKPGSVYKSKKREKQKLKESQQSMLHELSSNMEVDHIFLASPYHTGIVAGFSLIASYLESIASSGRKVEAAVIGLGAGLLPMFLHRSMPFFQIEVVELDPVVLEIARDHFGFYEDKRLKVHLFDGIQFVKKLTKFSAAAEVAQSHGKVEPVTDVKTSSNGDCITSEAEAETRRHIDILIIDVDSSDSSSGLTCPAVDFVEDSFLSTVKDAISQQGLFVINLVSRSPSMKNIVLSRMKLVFSHLYCLKLEEDVNEVLFALNSSPFIKEGDLSEAAVRLEKMLENPERCRGVIDAAKKIRLLK
ncbi:hypothetical protein Nepgr_030119 [Nepenthes gracilis]|uniref:Methyltransferase type 11 domain-containing protein n=1 Tax=Nepenthes gracilis TaxID=150966 RepID=A0AAD3Y689_NEPGR|nr:hypothetical protein Nepgr_030119 [Nepenthes gracilis]